MKPPAADNVAHPLDIAIGARIQLRRKALRISQSKLASASGITFQQVQKYESGANRISFSRLVEISQSLNCRVADLVGDLDIDSNVGAAGGKSPLWSADGATELLKVYGALPRSLRWVVLTLVKALAENKMPPNWDAKNPNRPAKVPY